MTVDMEQNGEAARIRLSSNYQVAVNEILGAVDPEEVYTTLDGERLNEYTLVTRVLAKAGAGWICAHKGCGCLNLQSSTSCDVCGKRRPPRKSIPKAEVFI